MSILIFIIGALAILQPTPARQKAALVFAGLTLLHEIVFKNLDGLWYYGSAAFVDMAIISITANLKYTPRLIRDLHRVCLASIILNASGWIMWMLYLSPVSYNVSFIFLYAWSVIVLLRRDRQYAGDNLLDSWADCFRFNNSAGFHNYRKL
jgi:hypothetical protein